jgi:ATP-binding cassette subfamily B protein RaxB
VSEIVLEKVTKRFGRVKAVDGVSFRAEAGKFVVLLGPSGCGKSTVLKLASGLIAPDRGEIRIAGQCLTGAGLRQIRQGLAVVSQEDVLFSGSIVQNVTFFALQPDFDAVEQACRLVEIHSDVLAMPMGYDTRVGQLGSVLSAGQKQRLLLARALYRRPWLLILDEATAHLDEETERRVFANLATRSLTCLLASHSPRLPIRIGARVIRLS